MYIYNYMHYYNIYMQTNTKGLVYADIGPVKHQDQMNKQSNFLDLDDTRIEYAQLNHNLLTDSKNLEAQPLKEITSTGVYTNNNIVYA